MMKILIVDDDPNGLYMLEVMLKGSGYEVASATNGAEALKKLNAEDFDVIISDILMPVMDGFQLCRKVKGNKNLNHILFIFYTATYTDEKDEELALKMGADKFIRKPVEPDEFIKIVQGVIRDVEKGKIKPGKAASGPEKEVLKLYNERLVKKLEKKMLAIEREITERKLAEEGLQFERNKVVNILESMADGVYIVNQQYDIEYANPVLKKEFGAVEEGKCYEYLHDRKEVCPWCKNQEVFAGKTVRWEWHSTKNQKTYDLIDTPLINPDGSISKLEIFRDITDRKQAREALQKSELKLKQAIQGNSFPTFIIDNNHIITHWNKACESLTGFSASEVVGTKKQWLVFYAEERPVMADVIVDEATEKEIAGYYEGKYNKSILTEGAYEGEDFFPDLGEKGKWLFFTAAPLKDQEEKIIGAIETFRDITEQKKLEAQLAQSQKMEAIGMLAGGIAHDFNNLLTVIIGNAQLALMDVIKDESLRKEIEEIKKAGNKAAALTRQLLAFSRKQIVRPEILDINELLTDIEKMLGRLIGEDIELLTIPDPELWQVEIDPGQIEQVIMNLAVNARDAMPQGGKLTIETANVELDDTYFRNRCVESAPGHYVVLTVSDTGSGMDKETREHIFEPFFTTKEVDKGTGLGLSTVYGIAKQNNGFIWVYSEPGQGTTFKVYLPEVKKDADMEKKEQFPMDDLGGSETVFIVEDDDVLRKFVQEVLQSYGYRLLVAENGEDALRVCKEHDGQIDLMITDVVMPKMGGREAAERLQPLYPRMKVIYMSGYTDDAIVHHGVLEPGLNFLEKPFTPEGLARKVRETLESEN